MDMDVRGMGDLKMKRNSIALGLAVLGLALLPGAALAKGPKHDLVAGTGQNSSFKIHVNAQSGANGENPRGNVEFSTDDPTSLFNFEGGVSCMGVDGQDAVVAGTVETFGPGVPPGLEGLVYIVYISGDTDAWFASFTFGAPPPSGACGPSPGSIPFTLGNFVVHDS
jgi:hypothetical protein